MLRDDISEALRTLRMERGMSQADLADLAGVSRAAISNIERGKHNVTMHLAGRLAMALHINIITLYSGVSTTVVPPTLCELGLQYDWSFDIVNTLAKLPRNPDAMTRADWLVLYNRIEEFICDPE